MKRQIKIPTLVGLLVLLLGVLGGVLLVGSRQLVFLRADPDTVPTYVTLTNTTDTTFTVSWTTNKATTGTILFGTDQGSVKLSAEDDRDSGGQVGSYTTHHVTVGKTEPLSASTDYFFTIQSGGSVYDDQGKPYHVKTASLIRGQAPSGDTISGKVVLPDGSPAAGAIVYLTLPNTAPQSSLVTASGNWVVPLSTARSADLSGLATYDREAAIAQIYVQGTDGETSSATILLANARPVPEMAIGKNYNWQGSAVTTGTAGAQPGGGFDLAPLASPSVSASEVTLKYPGASEQVMAAKPAFLGTGPKGTKIKILVESTARVQGETTVASDGSWEWDVPTSLTPGNHKITITYTSPLGQLVTLTRSFTVLAAPGPAFVATPSGNMTPTPTPLPTAAPTAAPSTTAMPTIQPTPSTSPSTLPVAGESAPTFGMFGAGVLLVGLGLISLLAF